MEYFSPKFRSFFRDLARHNDRDWFKANKATYEREVKVPFEKLVEELIERSREFAPEIAIEPKEAIFRIYRDTRFSKDKAPYKDHVSAVISRGGRKDMQFPGFYLEISADRLRVYGGLYLPEKEQIQRVREAIAQNLEAFNKLLQDPGFREVYGGTLHGDQHKRIPKEFKEAAELQPLIANKQFYYFTDLEPDLITTDRLADKLIEVFRIGTPMKEFLTKATGQ